MNVKKSKHKKTQSQKQMRLRFFGKLSQCDTESERQGLDDLFDELIDRLGREGGIPGGKGQAKRHGLLALADLSRAINVKEAHLGDILACGANDIGDLPAGHSLVGYKRQVAGNGRELGNGGILHQFGECGGDGVIVDLADIGGR